MSLHRIKLILSWRSTTRYLRRAHSLIPQDSIVYEGTREAQDLFHHFLDHNELELALDALESVGEEVHVPVAFWKYLKRAATNMELSSHIERYTQKLSQTQD